MPTRKRTSVLIVEDEGIVASMGGELDVESRVGEGTTFHVRLPASVKEPSSSPLEQPVAAERRGRLLLIDDEDMVLKALARVLGNHAIVCTNDARDGLARLQGGDKFDIIFCDLMMPTMTGMAFYEELLRLDPELARRVVFLTGGTTTSTVAEFLETVPNLRIQKPFGVRDLRAMVQQILAAGERT